MALHDSTTKRPQLIITPDLHDLWCELDFSGFEDDKDEDEDKDKDEDEDEANPCLVPASPLYLMTACCYRYVCRNCLTSAFFKNPKNASTIHCAFDDCRKPANFVPLPRMEDVTLTAYIYKQAASLMKQPLVTLNPVVVDTADALILLRKAWYRLTRPRKLASGVITSCILSFSDPSINRFFSALERYLEAAPPRLLRTPEVFRKELHVVIEKALYAHICEEYPDLDIGQHCTLDDGCRQVVLIKAMKEYEDVQELVRTWIFGVVDTLVSMVVWRFLERFETSDSG